MKCFQCWGVIKARVAQTAGCGHFGLGGGLAGRGAQGGAKPSSENAGHRDKVWSLCTGRPLGETCQTEAAAPGL